MKVLMVGDVVGKPGRKILRRVLPELKRELALDFVVVNGENAAAGFGLTEGTANEIFDAGANVISGGHLAARALKNEGVDTIFTLCGGHIIDIYDGCLDEGIRIVDVRHEQAAVHAADLMAAPDSDLVYRTGDLVRMRPDGDFDFLGRRVDRDDRPRHRDGHP